MFKRPRPDGNLCRRTAPETALCDVLGHARVSVDTPAPCVLIATACRTSATRHHPVVTSEHLNEEEQLARELAEELSRMRIEDVLIQTLITISSIGYRRLGLTEETKDDRDLQQAKLAIDTMAALTPVLESVVPDELVRDFNQSVASLQLAYAQAAGEGADGEG
jgi:hypothetical protein